MGSRTNLALALPFALGMLAGGCARGDSPGSRTPADSAAIARVRAESAIASTVAAQPASGLWNVDQVSERLVRSGVAPRRTDPVPPAPAFFATATETGAFAVGRGGELRVFIFRDSTARRRATVALDPATASPRDATSAWPRPALLIVAQNLAAVLLGGSATLQERVQLALEAGAPSR